MSDTPAPPQFVWTCPKCARRVPNRLNECRCGFQWDAETQVEFAPLAPPSNSRLPWIVLGTVALAAAGILIALQVIPIRPQPLATSSAPVPAAPSALEAPDPAGGLGAPAAMRDVGASDPGSLAFSEPALPMPSIAAPPASSGGPPALEDVVSRSIPAIVSIETREGRGSGFFAAPRTVLTNRHVIQDNVSVTVRLASGQTLPGRVEASSQEFDLAIVRVDGASPSQALLPLGSVSEVRPGQEVIAIGLALGVFQNSVTRGIISAVRRSDRTVMLQTDAAINPGNSGGPLMNRNGQVVGINTLKISGAAESLGFAVAIDHARGMLSGGQPSESPMGTTAQTSQSLAPAFTARSPTDQMREEGARKYEQVVQAVGRRAAQIDGYWDRIKANCRTRVAPGYDREWFGLWDGRSALTSQDASCVAASRDLEDLAAEIRTVMSTAQEDARRSSVLPGQLRDVRRKYRMDWPGWER
jgi:S1-C subfamily serine protease